MSILDPALRNALRTLKLTRLQPRPCHPKKDAAAQETFKKTSVPC